MLEIRDRETVQLREEWQLMEAYQDLIETRFEDRVNYRFSYKINRGSWETVETKGNGEDIPNRSYLQGSQDTIFLKIRG